MFSLDTVTLISVNCLDPQLSVKALKYSSKSINFARVVLLTDKPIKESSIEVQNIKSIPTIRDYNEFCTRDLVNYISTDHCLIIQPDGFVVNPALWDNRFLEYDYIGAPWNKFHSCEALYRGNFLQHFHPDKIPYVVGNGGFSLRSKKILKEISVLPKLDSSIPEDNVYSIMYRKELKDRGINIAPASLARRFSLEHILDEQSLTTPTFGFHGRLPHLSQYLEILNNA